MKDIIKELLSVLKIEEDHRYRCDLCRDTGYVVRNGSASPCKCKEKGASLPGKLGGVLLKDFNLEYYPKEMIYPERSRDTYYDRAAVLLNAAMAFVQGAIEGNKETKGLFITGPIGSGKTQLVSGIYNELKRQGKEVLFFVVPDLLEQGKADLFVEGKGRDVFAKAKKAEVLILDDLGAHNYTPWTINQLFTLINHRLNNGLLTIITTNLNLEDIDHRLDERIASRILELCNSYVLEVDQDIRYKKNILKK